MRVRIIRRPRGVVDGMSLHYYHAGQAYDVSPELAEYLVAAGFASIEMRKSNRSSRPPGSPATIVEAFAAYVCTSPVRNRSIPFT